MKILLDKYITHITLMKIFWKIIDYFAQTQPQQFYYISKIFKYGNECKKKKKKDKESG